MKPTSSLPLSPAAGSAYAGIDHLEIMAEARNYNAFLAALVARHAPQDGAVLDFGAGAGTFAVPLARAGFAVRCIEPDPALRERLRGAGLAAEAALDGVAPRSIDYVYSLNVLEHIDDDGAALAALFDRLRPGGRLLLYVPAFAILFSSMDRKVGHVRRYRKAPLVGLVRAAGFAVEAASYCDALGFLAALAYRIGGDDGGDIDRRALALYDRFGFPVSRALDRICGPLFGKNLIVVARRPGDQPR